MNLIFLDSKDTQQNLPLPDPRAQHMLDVLKMTSGSRCFVGIPNGPRGIATLTKITPTHITLELDWDPNPPTPLYPVHCLIGLPRPQAARKILQSLASLGVSSITFFQGEKAEPSYSQSSLWTSDEWKHILHSSAEQAFTTTFPAIHHFENLNTALTFHTLATITSRLALDVYEATASLSEALYPLSDTTPILIGIGPERGWTPNERSLLRENNFTLCDLGERVLKSETATLAATTLALSHLKVF